MEANLSMQSNVATTNLNTGRGPAVSAGVPVNRTPAPSAANTPAPAAASTPPPRQAPRQAAPAQPTPALTDVPQGMDILSAHSNLSPRATLELTSAADIPLPFHEGEISEAAIASYIDSVNEALGPTSFRLNFDIHEATNLVMVQVIDRNTEDIIREVPPESRLDIVAKLREFAGLLFDETS